MKWNRRKIARIKRKLTSVENYCDTALFKDEDISNNPFYGYTKDAVKKLREEIVLAHNNFRAKLGN